MRVKVRFSFTSALFIYAVVSLCGCSMKSAPEELQKQLSSAAHRGDVAAMRELIALGADINKACCGMYPPLHAAASEGHDEATRFLLERGAKVNLRHKFDATALMEAALDNQVEIARLLICYGADVNARETFGNQTILDIAQRYNYTALIELLKERGAK